MPTALAASIRDALHSLPPCSVRTPDSHSLLRLRTCAALSTALAQVESTVHSDADVARIVYATYAYVVQTLTAASNELNSVEWYWEGVAKDLWRAGVVWLQST
jgi:hypothetical protein